ncbi:unnamed protein product [Effrenium voratum]|uniref:Uncharacterized protein n=1 Tax=Effrenium voratum TaxID=2562239 RepID=A0AA36JNB9_9DINO|nr:unnamed protein product [Effrenium voratum]CAJ1453619.1 unnamed protein product [Effrenium voratum]
MEAEADPRRRWTGDYAMSSGAAAVLPSIGSRDHALGTCRPCAWLWKPSGCRNAQDCTHCHLCDADAFKKRRAVKGKSEGKGKRKDWEEPSERASERPAERPAERSERPRWEELRSGWSRGSEGHGFQECRPCLLRLTSAGCTDGADCEYCHICVPEQYQTAAPERQSERPVPWEASGTVPTVPGGWENREAHFINLAERLQPEASAAATMAPVPSAPSGGIAGLGGLGASPVVLGTAPYPTPMRTMPPRRRREIGDIYTYPCDMQMGVNEAPACLDCGSTTLCVCHQGAFGFSERNPRHWLPSRDPGGRDWQRRNGGEANPTAVLRDLMQNDAEAGDAAAVADALHASGKCKPCLELLQTKSCRAGAECEFCHLCVVAPRRKKINNMSLKKRD